MDVNLWFARDDNKEIISIVNAKHGIDYTCPICSSKVIPKALESKKITPHFAHVDKKKCNSESMLHWWFKHKFIEQGEAFKIKTDKEIEFTCKKYDVEKNYHLESGAYRPDLVITTECGNEIIFEMANSNKKKVQDYIDRWIELGKVVVEIDIKSLMGNEKVFPALFYKGKCFNFNKRDGGYYNSIGKLKERMIQDGNYDIEKVKELDWFWSELVKYKESNDMSELFIVMDAIDEGDLNVIDKILYKTKCTSVYYLYIKNKLEVTYNNVLKNISNEYPENLCNLLTYELQRNCFTLEPYLSLKNLNDGCVYLTRILNRDFKSIMEDMRKTMDVNIKYMDFEDESKRINVKFEEIKSVITSIIQDFISDIQLNGDYEIDFHFTNKGVVRRDMKAEEDFIVTLELKWKTSTVLREEFKVTNNIDSNLNDFNENIINYFKELIPFGADQNEYIREYILKLEEEYSLHNIKFDFYNYREDKAWVSMNLNGRFGFNDYIESSDNIDTKFIIIENKIIDEIIDKWEYICRECHNDLKMSFGEIEFYISKGFKKPRVCKRCKQKRKMEC